MKKVIATTNAPAAIGPYSQAIQVGNMLFASGQLGIDPATGNFVEGAVKEQTAQAFKNVKAILAAGAEAAVKGAEATKDMKANFGRARNYGERSIGYADSGASSWSCMFDAYAKAL